MQPPFAPENTSDTLARLRELAEAGNSSAQYYLGMSCHLGLNNATVDQTAAVHWLTRSAEGGNVQAQYMLGQFYQFGHHVTQDMEASVRMYRMAAEQGHRESQMNLAAILMNGAGSMPANPELAALCLKGAVQGGHAPAALALGRMYEEGQGVPQDDQQAYEWFLKADELQEEKGEAAYSLGLLIATGRIVGQPDIGCISWFEKAAEAGHAHACYELAQLYQRGSIVFPDEDLCVRWLEMAADRGRAEARLEFGLRLASGGGTARNVPLSLHHLGIAAQENLPDAQYTLGMLHYQGKDVPQDSEQARQWFSRLAESGNTDGMFMLGVMAEDEQHHLEEAQKWFQAAAEKGHAPAQYRLASLYLDADPPLKDPAMAHQWWGVCALNPAAFEELREQARESLARLAA